MAYRPQILSPDAGGTGINNGTSTLTLAGNLATAGAFASTFTMTGATSVTFPTSGTLATTSAIPSFPLSPSNGGTGVNNGTNTLTLAGNLATSGAFASTFTMTAATSVTFPTSGTLATTAQLPSLPLSLANGGTNANLTANNGGIFYSTGTAGAILAGTSTANQVLLSGSSTTPAWSTATYPATTTINQLLYSSSANIVGGLTTANNGTLVTSNSGVPSILTTSGANTVLTSNSGAAPSWKSPPVVQTVFSNGITGSSTSSASFVDVTSANLAITPTSASNKILVTFSYQLQSAIGTGTNSQAITQILRGVTVLSGGSFPDVAALNSSGNVAAAGWVGWSYVDAPATTSATTYKLQHKSPAGTITTGPINIILQEIVA